MLRHISLTRVSSSEQTWIACHLGASHCYRRYEQCLIVSKLKRWHHTLRKEQDVINGCLPKIRPTRF